MDFDSRVSPVEEFKRSYLDEDGRLTNLTWDYGPCQPDPVPRFSWQRPTGRLHEPQFFAAAINELKNFKRKIRPGLHRGLAKTEPQVSDAWARASGDIQTIRDVAAGWFGFDLEKLPLRGSFRGVTTRDTYTKAAHFVLLKEMLPPGKIVLTTERAATLPTLLPHLFADDIRENRFTWLAIGFNKTAIKDVITGKVKDYRAKHRAFHEAGLWSGCFKLDTDMAGAARAYIAEHMTGAQGNRGGKAVPFPPTYYQGTAFPTLWPKSSTQASGEVDKVVGLPIVRAGLRQDLKAVTFDGAGLTDEIRAELAELVDLATLHPVSSFMNSVRARLSAATRASSGGARLGKTYITDAAFNPKVLSALLNIYRVAYDYLEPKTYASPYEPESLLKGEEEPVEPPMRKVRYPGSGEVVEGTAKVRQVIIRKTSAMRHGIDAFRRRRDGGAGVPSLRRLIYRPWLYASTKVGAKRDRNWDRADRAAAPTSPVPGPLDQAAYLA